MKQTTMLKLQQMSPEDRIDTMTKIEMDYRDTMKAYLLLFFLGFIGAHLIYTGRVLQGFLYALTFGFGGIGLLIDLFMTKSYVEAVNGRIEDAYIEQYENSHNE